MHSKARPVQSRCWAVLLSLTKMILASFRNLRSLTSSSRRGSASGADTDTDTETDSDDEIVDDTVGWAYVGSHNFTPSAWGNLSGSGFNPSLNVRSFPCDRPVVPLI